MAIFTFPTCGFAAVWYCTPLSSYMSPPEIDPHPVSDMATQQLTNASTAFNFPISEECKRRTSSPPPPW
jgi:hypothetical protein